MTLDEQCTLSYYREIAKLNDRNVFLAQHVETKKIFVKKILEKYDLDVYRYLKEHPVSNTPRIYEVVQDGNLLIVIEEYLSGSTLEEILQKEGTLSEKETISIALGLCSIVRDLHAASPPVIHRDIKPSNIIISPDNVVKLLDMNAARQDHGRGSSDTKLMGTAGYAAPEQYGFGTSDSRTDIYAIGVVMNVALTGKFPLDCLYKGPLFRIIERCTKMDPGQRYQRTDQLIQALKGVLGQEEPCSSDISGKTKNPSVDAAATRLNMTKGFRRFLPPGFRSGSVWKMVAAAFGYYILFMGAACVNLGSNEMDILLNRVVIMLAFALIILFSGNYLGVQDHIPFVRSPHKFLRYILIILVDVFIFLFLMFALVLTENFLGW